MEEITNKGRQFSGACNLSYLARQDNIYIMDNHAAALWAWMQHVQPNKKYQLIHIDKHYDTLSSRLSEWINALPSNISDLSIEQLLSIKMGPFEETQIIRWDNYLPIFRHFYPNTIEDSYFFTHKQGSAPLKFNYKECTIIGLIENIGYLISDSKEQTILNLDIDYFFIRHRNTYKEFLTADSTAKIFTQIKKNINKIAVLTIALSPECCGGWNNSIKFYNNHIAPILETGKLKIK